MVRTLMGELSFRSDEVNVGLVAELDALFAAPLDTPKFLRFGTPTGSTTSGGVAALRPSRLSTPFLSMNVSKFGPNASFDRNVLLHLLLKLISILAF